MSIETHHEISKLADKRTFPARDTLNEQLQRNIDRKGIKKIFGDWAQRGAVYRWGLGVARSSSCDSLTKTITQLASDQPRRLQHDNLAELLPAAELFIDWIQNTSDPSAAENASLIAWAAALPGLAAVLEADILQAMIESMIDLRESVLECNQTSSVRHLMVGAELGLTLAWRCRGLPIVKGMNSSAVDAFAKWSKAEQESVSAALEQPAETRLVLASVLRCNRLIQKTTKHRWTKQSNRTGDLLATWVTAMTTCTGSSMFSGATRQHVVDDTGKSGLLNAACSFNAKSLKGAMNAALGQKPAGGRLAWQVALPESMHHDPDAKLAVMFPDWDVRRGRTHIDYSGDDVRVEIFAGRTKVIGGTTNDDPQTAGIWQTSIETDRSEQQPDGPWTEICEYSDDDVHYLEIEQPWTAGLLLQRQFMLIRDDRCLMLADSIIPQDGNDHLPGQIKYSCRLPMPQSMGLKREPQTREAFVCDKSKRALVIPMSASEWTIGPTDAVLDQSDDGNLTFTTSGSQRLYAPLWFDLQKRRFKRMRTWRQLTVADQLRLVGRNEAVGYRVQVGSEQWIVYRSLAGKACRSFLGKHMIADFFSARFDPEDGGHEALVTVDDNEHDE